MFHQSVFCEHSPSRDPASEYPEGEIRYQFLHDGKRLREAKARIYAHDATNRAVIEWVEMDLIEQSKLSYATCRRIMSACRGYWTFLQRRHKLDCPAPFDKVVPKVNSKVRKKAHSETRKGFAAIDYSKLLDGAQGGSEDLSGLIRLGAYTGARIEELCSLPLTNVGSDRLHIEDAKTEAGLRIIPIHRECPIFCV